MPSCHKCPHQGEIEKLRAICLACQGPRDDSHGGVSFVSIDAAGGSAKILRPAPDYNPGGERAGTGSRFEEEVPPELRPYILGILKPFWQMDFWEWVVIGGKIRGMSDKEIAEATGQSKQMVWEVGERVARKHARLGGIRTGLDGVRKGGRVAKPRAVTQPELFPSAEGGAK